MIGTCVAKSRNFEGQMRFDPRTRAETGTSTKLQPDAMLLQEIANNERIHCPPHRGRRNKLQETHESQLRHVLQE